MSRFTLQRVFLAVVLLCALVLCFWIAYSSSSSCAECRATVETMRKTITGDRWMVTTARRHPSASLARLVGLAGWKVVAVADESTPPDWNLPGAVFLSIPLQKELGYSIVGFLPGRHLSRKNVGYLFAIERGARVIYDISEDITLLSSDLEAFFGVPAMNVLIQAPATWNPYPYFGQPTMWPRGYPLHRLSEASEPRYIEASKEAAGLAWIKQGLASRQPDVDAIFTLTRTDPAHPTHISFSAEPPVLIPRATMVPWNSQNTIVHYHAFWALMLPPSGPSSTSDITRSYWAQRLLWDAGGSVAFFPPQASREGRSEGEDLLSEEVVLHAGTPRLLTLLAEWSSTSPDFKTRISDLSSYLEREGAWRDAAFVAAWLSDLRRLAYRLPSIGREAPRLSGKEVSPRNPSLPSAFLHPGALREALGTQRQVEGLPSWCVMETNMRSRIWSFTFTWNEEGLLPYYIGHYSRFADRIFIYDGNSTDATRSIAARCPKVEFRYLDTGGKLDDSIRNHAMNNVWKEARGRAEYVVVGDLDEFIHYPGADGMQAFLDRQNDATLFPTRAYTMANLCDNGRLDETRPITEQVRYGTRYNTTVYDKYIMFASELEEINYSIGCHEAKPKGRVVLASETLQILHQKFPFGLRYAERRGKALASHFSQKQKDNKWGDHVLNPWDLSLQWSLLVSSIVEVIPTPKDA